MGLCADFGGFKRLAFRGGLRLVVLFAAKSPGVGERSLSKKDIVVEVEPVEFSLSLSSLSLIDDVDEDKETVVSCRSKK